MCRTLCKALLHSFDLLTREAFRRYTGYKQSQEGNPRDIHQVWLMIKTESTTFSGANRSASPQMVSG